MKQNRFIRISLDFGETFDKLLAMKTYIVYVNGLERGYIKASSHNAAEKKARNKYCTHPYLATPSAVTVTYTEL